MKYNQEETLFEIIWQDGHISQYPTSYLRQQCPCALCKNARKESGFLKGIRHPMASALKTYESVGNYAINFKWGDGHLTGIYSFKLLRELCPCIECGKA